MKRYPEARRELAGLHAQMNTSEVCPERVVTSLSEITRPELLLGG